MATPQKSPSTKVRSNEAALRREVKRLTKELAVTEEAAIEAVSQMETERREAVETAERFRREAEELRFQHSEADYFEAFAALQEEGIHENHIALLKAHFNAPSHKATAAQLAKAVGYANWGGANLQYGTLGRRVGEKLGLVPKQANVGAFLRPFSAAA